MALFVVRREQTLDSLQGFNAHQRTHSMKDKISALRCNTSISWVWQYLGLPGKANRTCRSPFRDDKNASFSVWKTSTGDKWRDHGTNETGDVVDFYAKAKDLSVGKAIGELYSLQNISIPPATKEIKTNGDKQAMTWRKPNVEECGRLAKLRGLDASVFDLAGRMGTLKVGDHPTSKERLWWLTDVSGHASEGRTFDGQACQATGKKVAALPGSRKDFPVGLKTTNPAYDKLPHLLIVEGSADYFAGLHMSLRIGVNFSVCSMLGAACNICDDAVPLFSGKAVCILAHNDEAGFSAAQRWRDQIMKAEGSLVVVQPLPTGYKDLNDLMLCPLYSFTPSGFIEEPF